jgi:hypothetical protein
MIFYRRCGRLQSGAAAQADSGGRLMTKVPGFAKAIVGRRRLIEMDDWDGDFRDLVEEAHLMFEGQSDGETAFGALKGFLDVRYGARDGSACAESHGKDTKRMTPPAVVGGSWSAQQHQADRMAVLRFSRTDPERLHRELQRQAARRIPQRDAFTSLAQAMLMAWKYD